MNKYLAKLKTAKEVADCFDSFDSAQGRRVFEKNRTADLLPKPPKPPFDSFDSNAGSHFFEKKALPHQLPKLPKAEIEVSSKLEQKPVGCRDYPAPRIVCEPPFGSDGVPERYRAAWRALLTQCPLGVAPFVWEAAIYDAALLFGDFGKLIDEYRWAPGDLCDVPHDGKPSGLIWFIQGSPVVAIGRSMAQLRDGRIWRKGGR